MSTEPRLKVVFYKSQTGKEPVRDWFKDLPLQDKKALGRRYQDSPVRLAVGDAVDLETRARFGHGSFGLNKLLDKSSEPKGEFLVRNW